jgi:hypothetical protein
MVSPALASKPVIGFLVEPQNQGGGGFPCLGLKTKWTSVCRDLAACFAWKQVWLGFSSLARRLVEARRQVVHVAPSWRLRQRQVEDEQFDVMGYVGPCYPTFIVFNVLGPMGIVVI